MDCVCRTCDKHGQDPFCHGKCPEYKEYEAKLKEFREKKWQKKTEYIMLTDTKRKGIKRMFGGVSGRHFK